MGSRARYTMAEPSRDGCTTVQEVSLGTREHSFKESGPDHSGTEWVSARMVMHFSSHLIATHSSAESSPWTFGVIKGCIPWRRMRKNNFQKLMILNLSRGITSLLFKLTMLVETTLEDKQQNPSLQLFRKVKIIRKRHRNTSLPYRHKQSLVRKPLTYATLKTAVNLGNEHEVNLRHAIFWSSAGQLFG